MAQGLDEPLAIIGIGCRLPGGIENPRALWSALASGRDFVVPIPDSRWSQTAFFHPDPATLGASYSRWAGLVAEAEMFDAAFFGITPREARRLDPQQRWFLEASWRSLEDAGQRAEDLRQRPIGVFVGCSSSDYGEIQRHWRFNSDLHTNTGAAVSLIANRVSYAFDLRGPSLVVDTACSSSLVALDLAARAICAGECEAALVGGVNALFMPEATIGFAAASMLARDGKCKAFDDRADGYVRGEGAVALMLKPLERAQAEGDRIYAVVLATAVNQDGGGPGITVPSEAQQRAMLEAAYAAAGVEPLWVGGVEAHGTGTPVGDPIEARALGSVLGAGRRSEDPLLIGSVKTNLGHLEPASGAAGLAKLALSLRHGKCAPSLNFRAGNREIDFAGLRLKVNTALQRWPAAPDGRHYGGVNSFGFGGTNAHAVLSSPPEPRPAGLTTTGPIVWPFSARSLPALEATLSDTIVLWRRLDEGTLRRCAAAQARRRSAHPHRFAAVAADKRALLDEIAAADPAKLARCTEPRVRRALFIFSGQGGQWHGMARDLAEIGPAAAEMAEQVDRLMPPVAGRRLLEALRDPDPAHADRTDVVQPLLFLQQLMLAAQLHSWGIVAAAVCGHSVGEVAAAYWSGALTLEDAVTVVHHRSRLQERTRGGGAMAAVGIAPERARHLLAGCKDVCLAAVNDPGMVTLAGSRTELDRLCRSLQEEGCFVRPLAMPYAFHSPRMDELRREMTETIAAIAPRPGQLPFFSTVTGSELCGNDLDPEYWWQNLRRPVLFRDAVAAACRHHCDIAVELGPQPGLLRSAAATAASAGCTLDVLPTLRRDQPAALALMQMLGQAWSLRLEPNWSGVYPGRWRHEEALPCHPWQRERHWLEAPASIAYRTQPLDHPLLGRRIYGPGARWECVPDVARVPDLADHRVGSDTVFPAAGYVEQIFAAGSAIFGDVPLSITHLTLERVLTLDRPRSMQIERDQASGRVQIWSETGIAEEPWARHVQARVLPGSEDLHAPSLPAVNAGVEVSVDTLYRRFDEGGNRYGPRFRCVRELRTDGAQAWGSIALHPDSVADAELYRFHPALLDAALQMVLELLRRDDRSELYLPLGVDRIEIKRKVGHRARCLVRNAHRRDGILSADIYVYDEGETPIAALLGCRCRAIESRAEGAPGPQTYGWAWQARPADPVVPERCLWRLWGFCDADVDRLRDLMGADNVGMLGDAVPSEGTIVCWFRPGRAVAIDGARDAVLDLARFVQQLAGTASRLFLVTEGATWGHGDAAGPVVALAGVWALGRSLVTERPVTICGMTDLEPGTALPRAVAQVGAGLADDTTTESAWRGGRRLVHELRHRRTAARQKTVRTDTPMPYALTVAEPGGIAGLQWQRRAVPAPGPGQVVIAVEAAGLNFRDVLKTLDLYPMEGQEWRWLGDECAGTIIAAGAGVERWASGDAVVAVAPDCMASHVVADARLVVARPPSMSAEIAAGVPIAFLTAWYALIECGRLKQGETVLIHAAAGGVGQAAIQVAHHVGARVLATASADKQAIVAALGVDAVFNSRDFGFAESVREATGDDGVDVVLNSLAGEALLHSVDLLKPFGRFVEIGKRDIYANRPLDLRSLRDNRGFFTVDVASWIARSPDHAGGLLGDIMARFEAGELRPVKAHVKAIRAAPDSFRAMSQGIHTGKLVFRVASDAAPLEVVDRAPLIVRADAAYLITGGTSGLGLQAAEFLAKEGARHLVLASRGGQVRPAERATLARIQDHGAAIHLRQCDVGDLRDVKALLDGVRAGLPPLRGIVHGAAVLDDVGALELDGAHLDRVLIPKARGAWNLGSASEQDALDWFLMHGSVAAQLGAPGQSNYVVANHLLEALAMDRRGRGLPAQVISWGPIAESGLVARSARLQRYFEHIGLVPLSRATVEEGIARMLRSDEAMLTIFEADWSRFGAAIPGLQSDSRFRHLFAAGEVEAGHDLLNFLRQASPDQRQQVLARTIRTEVATVLAIDLDRIAAEARLSDLGLDSLMTFELAAALEAKIGVPLPLAVLQGNTTIEELVRVLETSFAAPEDAAPARVVAERTGKIAAEDSGYLQLQILPAGAVLDPAVRFESAALTYVPDAVEASGGLGSSDIRAAFGDKPFLSSAIDTPLGRVGTLMLPVRARDLFSDRGRTLELVREGMQLAAAQGARVMTLTGLLPSATAYGAAIIADDGRDRPASQALTTGHAVTTATIVASLAELLQRCGREWNSEGVAVVGLGSVGRSVLELMLQVLPHPRNLVLCDLYGNRDAVESFRCRIERDLGFCGPVEFVAGDTGLPPAVLDERLIVTAVDRTELIDALRLRPGTILLDDSYPAAFSRESAWQRMDERRDVIVASGGFARLPGLVRETIYVPAAARAFLQEYGTERFIDHFRREPCDYTACVLAGPLSLSDASVAAETGMPTPLALQSAYAALQRHRIVPAPPQCGGRAIPEQVFAELRRISGDG